MTAAKIIKNNSGATLGGVLLASAFLHLLLLYLAFTLTFKEKPKWTFGPIHTVSLVSLSNAAPARETSGPGSRSFLPEMVPRHQAITLRKPLDLSPQEPLRRLEIPRKDQGPTPKISDEIIKKAGTQQLSPSSSSSNPAPAAAAATAARGTARDESKGESPASLSDREMSAGMQAYYDQIWARIKGNWTIPPSHIPKGKISATVIVKLAANGTVTELDFENRSGDNYFDESAVRAIKKASPFPPLPQWIKGEMEIGIRFHSSDLKQ